MERSHPEIWCYRLQFLGSRVPLLVVTSTLRLSVKILLARVLVHKTEDVNGFTQLPLDFVFDVYFVYKVTPSI